MTTLVLRSGTLAGVLAAETRSEILKAIRLPAFLVPTIVFPAMFYVLFGLMLNPTVAVGGVSMSAYLLASYGTFGVVGAALFGMGIGVAAERGQGWLTLKKATPMPPLAYFLAKAVMSMIVGAVIASLLAALGVAFGGVHLPLGSWMVLLVILALGAIPFCAFGCALGYLSGPSSAPMLANLIYLPMSLASGLWIPLEFMPAVARTIAPYMPPYHLAQLALIPISGDASDAMLHVAALIGFTALFLAAAVFAYRRDDGRTWG
ncbi:MAG: ABC transporter permease [Longimicrobiales bacterium]